MSGWFGAWSALLRNLTIPQDAGPDDPRIVIGPDVPPILATDGYVAAILFYVSATRYHFYGIRDDGGGGYEIVRGFVDETAGTVTVLERHYFQAGTDSQNIDLGNDQRGLTLRYGSHDLDDRPYFLFGGQFTGNGIDKAIAFDNDGHPQESLTVTVGDGVEWNYGTWSPALSSNVRHAERGQYPESKRYITPTTLGASGGGVTPGPEVVIASITLPDVWFGDAIDIEARNVEVDSNGAAGDMAMIRIREDSATGTQINGRRLPLPVAGSTAFMNNLTGVYKPTTSLSNKTFVVTMQKIAPTAAATTLTSRIFAGFPMYLTARARRKTSYTDV